MRNLWRLHIRPYGGDGDKAASVELCVNRRIIGMGWAVPNEKQTKSTDFNWYIEAARRQHANNTSLNSVRTFAKGVQLNDLVWFRNLVGRYYLAEILGPWQYAYEDQAAIAADVVNFREARIIDVGLADSVPGKIISCFRPSRTLQAIRSPGMLAFSEKLAGLKVTGDVAFDVFEFMSDVDLENLVFIYLQSIGWYVLPGTRTSTTAHYEFVLVSRGKGERAVAQVKSGHTAIDAMHYFGEEKAFLFAASGRYGAKLPPNVVIIKREELIDFTERMPHLLPSAVSTWISLGSPTARADI